MDIRKFLKKAPPKRSNAAPSQPKSTTPRPTRQTRTPTKPTRKQTSPAINLNEIDNDSEEDFQPKRRRRPQPKPQPVQQPQSEKSRKRPRSEPDPIDLDDFASSRPTPSVHNQTSGFGGAVDPPATEAPPPAKKKRWVPRSDAPPNRGNKPLPVGASNCLAGKVFVITGVLDSLLREECQDLVKEYGARVVSAVSKKVTHGVVGTEPGESKMKKLKANRTPIIDEDQLFLMISSTNPNQGKDVEMEEEDVAQDAVKKEEDAMLVDNTDEIKPAKRKSTSAKSAKGATAPVTNGRPANAMLWVDKYRPSASNELVANPKAIKDLRKWLEGWKSKFLYGGAHNWKNKDRSDMDWAAALIVGAPGIGKTTAAHVVCRELGFEPHEFNASDVRNKGGVVMLAQTVMVANTMSKYLKITSNAASVGGGAFAKRGKGKRGGDDLHAPRSYPEGQVLIMDEVDGMSSGDRGGSQELIKMIKGSKVPIICIANDDSTSNMRSLSGHCFKLRFRRPMVTQVSKRLVEIAKREGFRQLQDQTLNKLAEGCNGDIRQMINMLQTWRCSSASLSFGQVKRRLEVEGKTVMQRSIFDLARGFFSPGVQGSLNSLEARTDNYFADSDLMPLFIQENYLGTSAAENSLESLADAAESISEGDLCNSIVRRQQRWELMPSVAILSSIRPGSILTGGLRQQPMFPSFLGNMSKGNKWKRIIQGLEMKIKATKTTSGSVRSFRLDYIPALTTCLATPLIRSGAGGVDEVVDRLDAYYLERDPDWLEILEAGVYAKGRSPLENVKGPVKTALTRAYNSSEHRRSTVTGVRVGLKQTAVEGTVKKVGGGEDVAVVDDDPLDEEEDEEDEEEDEEDPSKVLAAFGKKAGKGRGGRGGKAGGRGRGGKRGGRGGKRGRGRK